MKTLSVGITIVVMVMITACTSSTPSPGERQGEAKTLRIYSNAQATFEDLKIATGNYHRESGELVGTMWVFYRGHPEYDQVVVVRRGDTVQVGEYRIDVTDVGQEGSLHYMEVRISKGPD